MSQDSPNKYRDRKEVPSEGGGLAREESRRLPNQGLDLAVEQPGATGGSGALPLVALVDELMPATGGVDAPSAQMDFGLAALVAEQRSERVAGLIRRIEALVAERKWRPALGVAQEARVADPASAPAIVWQVRCLMELEHYEPALRVVAYTRGQVTDPDVRSLLLRCEAACVRAATKALEARLVELVNGGKLEDGLTLVREVLARQPSNVVFLCHLATLQYRSSDVQGARRTLQEARRHIGRESTDPIAELERAIEFGSHGRQVEAARQALRQHDSAKALELLEACASDLCGNEHFDGLRELALEARSASRAFRRNTTGASAAAPSRQQTLRWIVSEELRRGEEALRAGQFVRAREALEAAERIDPRCGAVCYRHAEAIVLACEAGVKQGVRLGDGDRDALAQAMELARRATVDPAYEGLVGHIVTAIRSLQGQCGGLDQTRNPR
jgi:hypothetical protein